MIKTLKKEVWCKPKFVRAIHNESYFGIYKNTIHTAKKEVDFIERVLKLNKKAKVLDLGCGFGRHSIELAKRGYEVTGVDFSEELLGIAMQLSQNMNKKPRFILRDIRELHYNKEFDAVIIMLNAFGLMSDDDNFTVLKGIARALKRGGKVLIDLRNPEMLKQGRIYKKVEICEGRKVYTKTRYILSEKRVLIFRHYYKGKERQEYCIAIRLYPKDELAELLRRVGLRAVAWYGDFEGNSYDPNTSPRLIVVAEKL